MSTTRAVRLSEVRSRLLRPSLTSHFRCTFQPPVSAASFFTARGVIYDNNQDLIELSCSEATLPGSSIATIDIDNDYHGVSEKHAYRRLYDDRADFTFYVDRDYTIIYFFENWISHVVGEDENKDQRTPTYSYRMRYPKDYKASSLKIIKFERDNYFGSGTNISANYDKSLVYEFVNAYPISINSMPISYDSSQLLKCTVSFTYSRYVVNTARGTVITRQSNNLSGNPERNTTTTGGALNLYSQSGSVTTRQLDPNRSTLSQLNE
jgi:hypothetical protein